MTIKDCIDIVDNIKPNQYTIKDKVGWLSFIEGIIINEVLKTHEGYDGRYDDFEGYKEDKISVTLAVPSPYDRLYTEYLKMMIDKENGEVARYNNSMISYNTYMSEYRKHYNKTHMPLDITRRRKPMPPKKVSTGLSDAEYENLKRDMTYILTEYFSDSVSKDKLYNIVTEFASNNMALLKGKDGANGKDGKDGYTPKKGVDYFDGNPGKPFTYNDLTPEQLERLRGPQGIKGDKGDQGARGKQGEKGDKGDKGEKGYTPIKGVDYFTDDEIAQLEKVPNKVTEINSDSNDREYPSAKAVWEALSNKLDGKIGYDDEVDTYGLGDAIEVYRIEASSSDGNVESWFVPYLLICIPKSSVPMSLTPNVQYAIGINGITKRECYVTFDESPTWSEWEDYAGGGSSVLEETSIKMGYEDEIDNYLANGELYYITQKDVVYYGFNPYYLFVFGSGQENTQIRLDGGGIYKRKYQYFEGMADENSGAIIPEGWRWSEWVGVGDFSDLRFDPRPTEGSSNFITSGAVFDSLGDTSSALDAILAIQNGLMGVSE